VVEYGAALVPKISLEVLPEAGLILVVSALVLNQGANIRAYTDGTFVNMNIFGFVNRIS